MLIDLSRRSALDGRDPVAAPVHTERAAQAVPCWAVLGSLEDRGLHVLAAGERAARLNCPQQQQAGRSGGEVCRQRISRTRPRTLPRLFDSELEIGACGDWCLGGRVEAAFLSGRTGTGRLLGADGLGGQDDALRPLADPA
jgi:predicted NAD/FAD-dependent oxidoreductase